MHKHLIALAAIGLASFGAIYALDGRASFDFAALKVLYLTAAAGIAGFISFLAFPRLSAMNYVIAATKAAKVGRAETAYTNAALAIAIILGKAIFISFFMLSVATGFPVR